MPKKSNIHVDAPLSNLAIQYKNPQFIAPLILPVLPVMNESDKYYIHGREEAREIDSLRAIGTPSNSIDWDVSTATYSAEEYALRMLVADRVMANADVAVRPKITTANKIMQLLGLGYEKRVRDLIEGSDLTSAVPAVKWDASASVVIETNIDTAKQTILTASGAIANLLAMNDEVKDVVKKDSTVRNLIRYTIQGNGGQELLINGDLPPVLWGLKVVIGSAIENTAKKGQTASYSRIWSDDVLVAYVEPAPSLQALSLGYTMRKGNFVMKTWRDEELAGDFIEGSVIQDEKLVATGAGYLIDNVLAE